MNEIFELLYFLDSPTHTILEVKRTDKGNMKDKDLIYYWLLIDKKSKIVNRLEFQSMESKEGKEHRNFAQGKLEFNSHTGEYNAHYSARSLELTNYTGDRLPEMLKELVGKYLLDVG